MDKPYLLKLEKFLYSRSNILIIPNPEKKLDALSSAFALALVIEKINKKAFIYFAKEKPYQLTFLKMDKFLISNIPQKNKIDAVITIDINNNKNLFTPLSLNINYSNIPILNIESSNNSSSVAETLTRLLREFEERYIDKEVATALMTGLVASTQNFQRSDIKPQTLFGAAYLIAKKANNEEVVRHLYKIKSAELMNLWGSVISNLSFNSEKEIGLTYINKKDVIQNKLQKAHTAYLVNELNSSFAQAKILIFGIEGELEKIAILNTKKPKYLSGFTQKFNINLKNSSCIIRLNPSYSIKTGVQKLATEIETTL